MDKAFFEEPLKTYPIAGREFKLYKVKMAQLALFSDFVKQLNLSTNTSMVDIVNNLLENEIGSFMDMIFPNQGAKNVDWLEVDYDTVDEVLTDFFTVNPRLKERLKGLLSTSELAGRMATT